MRSYKGCWCTRLVHFMLTILSVAINTFKQFLIAKLINAKLTQTLQKVQIIKNLSTSVVHITSWLAGNARSPFGQAPRTRKCHVSNTIIQRLHFCPFILIRTCPSCITMNFSYLQYISYMFLLTLATGLLNSFLRHFCIMINTLQHEFVFSRF